MGHSFSSVQIYNPQRSDKTEFLALFQKKMQETGYIAGSDQNHDIAFVFYFTENSKWVTVSSEAWEQNDAEERKYAKHIAQMLDTYCMRLNVQDSDAAILDLYGKGQYNGSVILGDATDYACMDDILPPEKTEWETVLMNDRTLEQFSALCKDTDVFVESSLTKIAPLLDMECAHILFDIDDFSCDTDHTFTLYFRKKENPKERKMTVNTAFIQVFGKELEPQGFVRLKKMKHPYFVRLINDDILHIVTYRKISSPKLGYQNIEILGGAISLYRRTIDFSCPSGSWLETNLRLLQKFDPEVDGDLKESMIAYHVGLFSTSKELAIRINTLDGAFRRSIQNFLCGSANNETMQTGMKNAYLVTKHIMLRVLDRITCLESLTDYLCSLPGISMELADPETFMTERQYSASEGLLLVLTNNRDADAVKTYEKTEQYAIRMKLLDDPILNTRVRQMANEIKENHLAMLKSYGFDFQSIKEL